MAKNLKRETNVQFVKRIMEYGSPLRQAFVIEAIEKYAIACAREKAETFDCAWLSGAAWVQVAKEIRDECAEKHRT